MMRIPSVARASDDHTRLLLWAICENPTSRHLADLDRPPLVWLRGQGRRYILAWQRRDGAWWALLQHLTLTTAGVQIREGWHPAGDVEQIVGEDYQHVPRSKDL